MKEGKTSVGVGASVPSSVGPRINCCFYAEEESKEIWRSEGEGGKDTLARSLAPSLPFLHACIWRRPSPVIDPPRFLSSSARFHPFNSSLRSLKKLDESPHSSSSAPPAFLPSFLPASAERDRVDCQVGRRQKKCEDGQFACAHNFLFLLCRCCGWLIRGCLAS